MFLLNVLLLGVSRLNFWITIRESGKIVNLHMGCAEVLISGTADGIADHVKALFERGTETVKELRRILDKYGTTGVKSLSCTTSTPSMTRLKTIMLTYERELYVKD